MLQNRVDPSGNIIKTSARGAWMGNRGLLHDEHQNLRRPFRLKAWITCLLEFKERKRPVMAPGQYTELFFLDEATALSAGHRPCFECRRADAVRWKKAWLKGNPEYNFTERTPIRDIDEILHRERMDAAGGKVIYEEALATLPNGIFILHEEKPYLLFNKMLYPWSPSGYGKGLALAAFPASPATPNVKVLTPRSIVNTISAGYTPQTPPLNFAIDNS